MSFPPADGSSIDPRLIADLPRLLAKMGVDHHFLQTLDSAAPVRLPPGAAEVLVELNPWLAELSRRYDALTHAAVSASKWTKPFVNENIPLTRFRGDCGFVWQHRNVNLPVTYWLTYLYYATLDPHRTIQAHLDEDDLFAVYAVPIDGGLVSRDRLDSTSEIAFLERHLGLSRGHNHVLDIGSGYGRLAHRLARTYDGVRVTCTDAIARSTFLCDYYIRFRGVADRVSVVPLDEIDTHLARHPISVAVNIHSFSECRSEAVEWWLALLARHCVPYLMVVPNALGSGGRALTSSEGSGRHRDLLPIFRKSGYHRIVMEPKYAEPALQQAGVSPTHYHLFARVASSR